MVPVPVPVPLVKKLRFLRFQFRFHLSKSYGSYGSSSGSTSQKVTAPTVPVPQRCLEGGDDPPPGRLEDVLVRPVGVHLPHPSSLSQVGVFVKNNIADASKMFEELYFSGFGLFVLDPNGSAKSKRF
jgi:hypothetical protein